MQFPRARRFEPSGQPHFKFISVTARSLNCLCTQIILPRFAYLTRGTLTLALPSHISFFRPFRSSTQTTATAQHPKHGTIAQSTSYPGLSHDGRSQDHNRPILCKSAWRFAGYNRELMQDPGSGHWISPGHPLRSFIPQFPHPTRCCNLCISAFTQLDRFKMRQSR